MEIDERNDDYVVTFEIPGIKEENIMIKTEGNSLNVIAINEKVTTEMKEGKVEINYNSVLYDKTACLEHPDFSKMEYNFFASWLEVIVPKKKAGN